jgi:Fe-S oxidoreductase
VPALSTLATDVAQLTPFSSAHLTVRLVLGVLLTLVALSLAAWRGNRIYQVIRSGQPAVGRTDDKGVRLQGEIVEVLGQRKLLKWSVPGLAHFVTFWGFLVLGLTIIEGFGALFDPDFHIPVIGTWPIVGFLEDLFGLLVLAGLVVFSAIRIKRNPHRIGRESRFYGSHTGGAWLILASIATIVLTLFVYRGAQVNTGTFPYDSGAFVSEWVGTLLAPLGLVANEWIETIFILLSFGAVLGTTILVLYSKHMHIFLAPFNVLFSRRPNGLGPLLPMYSGTERIDFEDPADDAIFGRATIEDITWKGNLDLLTCTECGRCQSQCPAWNTEKPLSPKLLVMDMRDNLLAQAPYLVAKSNPQYLGNAGTGQAPKPAPVEIGSFSQAVQDAHARPLVGSRDDDNAVIDEDVLWSCTMCGACVNQCPVDIEHIDHIVDMRRNRVMIESEFPSELNGLFKNIENKGNPWGAQASQRNAWIEEVDFEVEVSDGEAIPDDVDYLFWVGCAGAFEDRAKKTTKAVAELLHLAGVRFMVLGEGETCTGDPARRAGNEFLFQMQAMQNVEMLNEIKAKKIVVTCPHCMNTIGREYPQLGGNYDVVHHSQLLATLVKDGRLTPVQPVAGLTGTVTYHDPCYLGRHNKVYTPPRELIGALPGLQLTEMERSADRSFCCGAGGARMWMEERLGTRINLNRTDEALGTGASTIAVACPFCSVMLNDGVTNRSQGKDEPVAVVADVATLLLGTIDRTKTPTDA